MISGLKPYPVYKDSGVPWVGEVPEHWEIFGCISDSITLVAERNRMKENTFSPSAMEQIIRHR